MGLNGNFSLMLSIKRSNLSVCGGGTSIFSETILTIKFYFFISVLVPAAWSYNSYSEAAHQELFG